MLKQVEKIIFDFKKLSNKKKLTTKDIEAFYLDGKKISFALGVEYERLSLDKKTLQNASYEKLEKIIENFCEITNWSLVYDNETIIGAKSCDGSSISLEPGCQLELSLSPKADILSIDLELSKYSDLLDKIADVYDVVLVAYGISPISIADEIKVLNKNRYLSMTKYLPYRPYGELALKMMRQTAGAQFNIDYKNEKDAYLKLEFFNLIMPFVSALCANSPFEKNRLSLVPSIRAHVWRYTGRERCNLFYKNIFSGFLKSKNVFKNYINEILKVPMIFIERDDKIVEINGKITFLEFMKNGYKDYFATMDDYILHQSLCFPDVRLKNVIEIRNHDSLNIELILALSAFYKGLASGNIKKYLSKFRYLKMKNLDKYYEQTILNGLNFKINNKVPAWKLVKELFEFAKKNLTSCEKTYLEPMLNMINQRKTKADLIIDEKIYSASELVEFINKY